MTSKSKVIASGGMMLALEAIILIAMNFVPINTIFIMGLASLISSIIIMEYGSRAGAVFSIASVLISFLIISNKFQWILFALTFAIYGSVKEFIERGRDIKIEWIIKIVFANIIFVVLNFLLGEFISEEMSLIFLVPFYNVAFVVYDIVYSQFILFYERDIRKHIKRYF